MARARLSAAEQALALSVTALAAMPVLPRERYELWVAVLEDVRADCTADDPPMDQLLEAADLLIRSTWETRDAAMWRAQQAAARFAEGRAALALERWKEGRS